MMYHHYFNILGPFGAVVQLPWMANWWIEGLAESLSQSQGSDVQAAVERLAALTGNWPTFNSLHSLYRRGVNSTVGYAISGGLVSHAFRSGKAENIAKMHREYYDYTMPWYMLWSAVPFNGFMPMDAALETITGLKTGRALYDKYKADSKKHWQKTLSKPLYMHPGYLNERPTLFTGLSAFTVVQGQLRAPLQTDGVRKIHNFTFNDKNWVQARSLTPIGDNPPDKYYTGVSVLREDYLKSIVKFKSRFLDTPQYSLRGDRRYF